TPSSEEVSTSSLNCWLTRTASHTIQPSSAMETSHAAAWIRSQGPRNCRKSHMCPLPCSALVAEFLGDHLAVFAVRLADQKPEIAADRRQRGQQAKPVERVVVAQRDRAGRPFEVVAELAPLLLHHRVLLERFPG